MGRADHPAFQNTYPTRQCNDPTCPCQDGDQCHYQGPDAAVMVCPTCGSKANRVLHQVGLVCGCGLSWVGGWNPILDKP